MTSPASIEILSSERLAGFWQFLFDNDVYLGLFETDEDGGEGRLSIGQMRDGRLQRVRPFAFSGPLVHALEGCSTDKDLIFALEINRRVAGATARLPITAVLDANRTPDELETTGDIDLGEKDVKAVHLPISDYWNIADSLRPEAWLFSPSPVCGDRPGGVVANTADGQATIVGYDGAAAFIPQAAHPQAWRRNSRLTIAFIRFNDAYRPFWSLKRYSGNGLRTNGALMVTDDAGSPMDLSATLGVGPVNAFASFLDRDGTDWLFGSRSNGSTSEVTAIRRAQGSWQVTQKWALDFPAERFAVERTEQGWHVVGERRSGSALTLRHVLLKT